QARLYFPSFEVPENNRIQKKDFRSGALRCQWLYERYCGHLKQRNVRTYSLSDNTILEHVRAFLFYYIGQCFFKGGDSFIRLGWLRGLIDLDVMYEYDWGGAVLAHLYLGLDLAVRSRKGGSLTGFVVILPYWWYEYLNTMMPIRNNKDHDIVPRIRGWGREHRNRRVSEVDHNVGLARQQIELRGSEGMIWHPWKDAAIFRVPPESVQETRGRVTSNACHSSRELTKTRMVLMGPSGWHAWYLGDRCWRQWNDSPLIPYPPPPDMQGRGIPMATLLVARQSRQWPGAWHFVHPDSDGDYDRYWARVSIGPLVRRDVYRSVNIDSVTSQALRPGLSIGGGFPVHREGVDDPWQCPVFTSQGDTTYVPIHSAPESYVTELTQQFAQLDMDALRAQLIQQSAL
ncbi:hypothetical protein FRX31_032813, partial [Thalictrum thalictroides]